MSNKQIDINLEAIKKPEYSSNLLKLENIPDSESLSANTEDSLLNTSRSGSETPSIQKSKRKCCTRQILRNCCNCCSLTTGLIFTIIGVLLLIWSPFYIIMESRLDMIPGLPAFEWWKTPPDEVYLRAYIFNVTNSQQFLDGTDSKLKVEEIGPIIYLEKLRHVNVTHNPNSTLSYTSVRTAEYLPEYNKIDLNSTIIVPNYALLGVATDLHDANFFKKIGFNILLRSINSPVFVNTTIYNFLWNITDPILEMAAKTNPERVSSQNYAMLDTIYRDFTDRATVFIGPKNGHKKFFLLDNFDGSPYLKGHGPSCPEKLVYATEGAIYPQYLSKNMTLRYWRKTLCRIIPLKFEREQFMPEYKVNAYKFTKARDAYNRKEDLSEDCFKGDPPLLSGLSDVSKCFNGISMAASYPHYLYGDEELQNSVEGLKPNRTLHESYTFVEPLTGIPITSVARSQSNIVIKNMMGFSSDLQKFNDMTIPMFWLEYEQVGLPYYVKNMINFTVNLCPTYQYYVVIVILIVGMYLLAINVKRILKRRCRKNRRNYKKNTKLQFEKNFLKT